MRELRPATPLAAVEAVVLDTETTGLDARQARIVQIGALLLRDGQLVADQCFDRLVNPGIPIPPASTAVHGVTDAKVADQPQFAAVAAELSRFVGGRLLLGHSLAYDLSILKREHELAGLRWKPPRGLDVRDLARIVAPALADHSLDRLCDWLEVPIEGRHTARGDAAATGQVFLRLVPKLREKGIRTIAEATAATARRAEVEARASRGLILLDHTSEPEPPPPIVDAYAYRHRVSDVMSAPPLFVDEAVSIGDAARLLLAKGTSSVFIRFRDGAVGIVTERDILKVAAHRDARCLVDSVGSIATTPVHGIADDDLVYRAIGRMARLGVRHLAVRDADDLVVGALTPRNLLRDRAMDALVIGDEIASAETAGGLAATWGRAPALAAALRHEQVSAREIAATLSAEIQALTARSAELAVAAMEREGLGPPPVAYAVLVLGSAGRGESLLAADQDNAIIYDHGEESGPEDRWFEAMAVRMNAYLDEAGIVLCKGGVMARNRLWRRSLMDWKRQAAGWIGREQPQDLLNVDIFFDAAPVHGNRALAGELLGYARERARASASFLKMLSIVAAQWRSPLTFFGGFDTEGGRLDLKRYGLLPIFTGARILALKHGIAARSSRDRLEAVKQLTGERADAYDAVIDAHETLLATILDQQVADASSGTPLSQKVAMERLTTKQRTQLKEALRQVPTIIDLVSDGRL